MHEIQETMVSLSLAMLALGLGLGLIRLVIGPQQMDRILALNLVSSILCGMACLVAVLFQSPLLLNIALGIVLVESLGIITLTRFLKRRS